MNDEPWMDPESKLSATQQLSQWVAGGHQQFNGFGADYHVLHPTTAPTLTDRLRQRLANALQRLTRFIQPAGDSYYDLTRNITWNHNRVTRPAHVWWDSDGNPWGQLPGEPPERLITREDIQRENDDPNPNAR